MWSSVQRRTILQQLGDEHSALPGQTLDPCGREPPSPDQNLSSESSSGSWTRQCLTNGCQPHHDTVTRIVVGFSGEEDPINPQNWPLSSRCKNIVILSFLVFVQGWAGGADSMSNEAISREFHVSKVAENLSTAMYLWGIGSGALFAGPVSESVGRNPTYLVSTFLYLCFVLGSTLSPTFGGQVACRYLMGLFSSATLAINGSSVSDQFRPVKRSLVFPFIAWANVAAPLAAPIAGGWITSDSRLGWRWAGWVTLIISSAAFLVALLFLPETYAPVLLDWKAKVLVRLTGDKRYTSEHAISSSFAGSLKRNLQLPLVFLQTEPVITVLGLYLVLLYTLIFTFLSGFDFIFQDTYHLSTGLTGSCFASIVAGATLFPLMAPCFYSLARWRTKHVRGAFVEPEFRLWPALVAAPLLPVSLFWLGWTSNARTPIWWPLGACFLLGMALISIYVSVYEYVIDSYCDHAATALATITMVRYLAAGGMVMAARPMYKGIGVHWTLTLLGCVAVVLAPAPLLFWMYGRQLRAKSPYARTSLNADRHEERENEGR